MIEFDMVVLTKQQLAELAKKFPVQWQGEQIVLLQNEKKRSEFIVRDAKYKSICIISE